VEKYLRVNNGQLILLYLLIIKQKGPHETKKIY
jgi:hypothetical protein